MCSNPDCTCENCTCDEGSCDCECCNKEQMMTLWKRPYIDVTYTGEWKFGKEKWEDTEVYKEYYIGPFLFRKFYT